MNFRHLTSSNVAKIQKGCEIRKEVVRDVISHLHFESSTMACESYAILVSHFFSLNHQLCTAVFCHLRNNPRCGKFFTVQEETSLSSIELSYHWMRTKWFIDIGNKKSAGKTPMLSPLSFFSLNFTPYLKRSVHKDSSWLCRCQFPLQYLSMRYWFLNCWFCQYSLFTFHGQ